MHKESAKQWKIAAGIFILQICIVAFLFYYFESIGTFSDKYADLAIAALFIIISTLFCLVTFFLALIAQNSLSLYNWRGILWKSFTLTLLWPVGLVLAHFYIEIDRTLAERRYERRYAEESRQRNELDKQRKISNNLNYLSDFDFKSYKWIDSLSMCEVVMEDEERFFFSIAQYGINLWKPLNKVPGTGDSLELVQLTYKISKPFLSPSVKNALDSAMTKKSYGFSSEENYFEVRIPNRLWIVTSSYVKKKPTAELVIKIVPDNLQPH
jgi:hypothetical protein